MSVCLCVSMSPKRKIYYLRKTYEGLKRQEYGRYLSVILKYRRYLRGKFHLDCQISHLRVLIVKALRERRFLRRVIQQLDSVGVDCVCGNGVHTMES